MKFLDVHIKIGRIHEKSKGNLSLRRSNRICEFAIGLLEEFNNADGFILKNGNNFD